MMSGTILQLFLSVCLAYFLPARGEPYNHLMTMPQSPKLEIGTNFTATCTITNTTEITADDLFWNLSRTTVPKEQYIKVNRSALNVTILITSETPEWLFCLCKKKSFYVQMNQCRFQHGIALKKGYRPEKPENLSCKAVQEKEFISPTISCEWEAAGHQTRYFPVSYTLFVKDTGEANFNLTNTKNAKVTMDIFPHYMVLDIWVESHNELGRIESEHLIHDANYFVKTNPPSNVKVISERGFPSSLLVNWSHPIVKEYMKLIYQIRFCPHGSHIWIYVPFGDTATDIQSFRLQKLHPDTIYAIQVRCKYYKEGQGYWSNWSTNVTKRTPEDRPSSKPDLWKTITEDGINERQVQIVCKDPLFVNGRIVRFDVRIQNQKDKVKNESLEWESIPTNRSEVDSSSSQQDITWLKTIPLDKEKSVKVYVAALNSMGRSPEASLGIPAKAHEHGTVQNLKVWPHEGHLLTEWKSPNSTDVTEYVVEWVSGGLIDWQRESRSTRHTVIKGKLQRFVRYTVSVYPIYSGWIGKPAQADAFVEQSAPSQAPDASLKGDPGRNEATLEWEEIPEHETNGFITHYTIFYGNGAEVLNITVPGNITSYTLKSLSANTKYDVWIQASTIEGSKNGSKSYFTTQKYAPGEIEGIVVGVSLGFLFVVLMTMLLCIYKKDVIKENFWPQIPNPGESTIGNWSPDYPLKAETPKENCLSGISVLDVDMCDAKCVFEEDKASLALKKDKYLSEEHSSGIGGSSCMSSPRQSVSDSDEGGDMADTTASTVQYSSVVASSGYKGQTPSTQPQQSVFSRSESTQPLLDSEENPDMLVQEGSRQFQRYPRLPCFPHSTGNEDEETEQQEVLESLEFGPLEEDAEQTVVNGLSADWLPKARVSSYMPQLGGYRPQ